MDTGKKLAIVLFGRWVTPLSEASLTTPVIVSLRRRSETTDVSPAASSTKRDDPHASDTSSSEGSLRAKQGTGSMPHFLGHHRGRFPRQFANCLG